MIKLKLSLSFRKDNLDIKRFPYDDKEAFRKAVSLTGPQDSLVDFLKVFPNICYIIRYNDERENGLQIGVALLTFDFF